MITLLPVPAVTLFLLSALSLCIMIRCFVNYRKLSQFKGPPLAAVSGVWLWRQSLAKRMHIAEAEVLRKYGTSTNRAFLIVLQLTWPLRRLTCTNWAQFACDG